MTAAAAPGFGPDALTVLVCAACGHARRLHVEPFTGEFNGCRLAGCGCMATGVAPAGVMPTARRGVVRPSPGVSVKDGLIALQDALDDPPAWWGVRLAALGLNAELTTGTQRKLLAVLLYELADAFNHATA